MDEIGITTTTIQLDQFLKWAGIVESGGQVKLFIEDGLVFVNDVQISERRKKLQPGDIVEIKEIGIWKVTAE
ncbi:RNA-binding S4 domain-containing protein [Pelosinus sp. UFO1]|jgi:ribosome-associated protein|uniref:RNA-binding S4 domain-containing protein n=1 Tax=Pelosinus sp. UFO1 TaxID=484770 RepID=UPI0004D1CC5B|nr:RNA-binding S4 domain-containing protein [Pelosinus sp. UFO1]AIF54014.1 S4 domain protein [Pelosinus sp. UFO1]